MGCYGGKDHRIRGPRVMYIRLPAKKRVGGTRALRYGNNLCRKKMPVCGKPEGEYDLEISS